jgi:hypothetical protein
MTKRLNQQQQHLTIASMDVVKITWSGIAVGIRKYFFHTIIICIDTIYHIYHLNRNVKMKWTFPLHFFYGVNIFYLGISVIIMVSTPLDFLWSPWSRTNTKMANVYFLLWKGHYVFHCVNTWLFKHAVSVFIKSLDCFPPETSYICVTHLNERIQL